MPIVMMVDSNEEATNPKVVSLLRKHYPDLEVMKLEFGDINIVLENGSLFSIERKNVSDFLGSIGNGGHMFSQVERMAAGAKFYAIVVLGDMSFNEEDMTMVDGRVTGWKGASVRAAIYALQWSGCPVVWVNHAGLPFAVNELIRFCEKPEVHFTMGHKRIVTFPPVDQRVEILASFPGIGMKKADALLRFAKDRSEKKGVKKEEDDDQYSTIAQALMWASAFPLIANKARPEGWGDKIVQTFRLALGLDKDQYLDIKESKIK